MTAVGSTIRQLREERGMTQEELAKAVGLHATGVVRRESGATSVKYPEMVKFAAAFGMTIEQFQERYRAGFKVSDRPLPVGIPVINRAAAGQIVDYDHAQSADGESHGAMEYIDRDDKTPHDTTLFAVIVVGDSMEPRIYEGDYVVFKPLPSLTTDRRFNNGKIVFIRFAPERKEYGPGIFRIYFDVPPNIRLRKDNPRYPEISIPFTKENITQCAVAVQIRSTRDL